MQETEMKFIGKLSGRERKWVLFMVFILFACGAFNFLYIPLSNKNKRLNTEITAARKKLMDYLTLIQREKPLLEQYENFFAGAGSMAVNEDDVISILSGLEKAAHSASVRIIDLRPENSAEKDGYKYKIDMKAEGSIEGYIKLIYMIENQFSFLTIENLMLNVRPRTEILEGRFALEKLSQN